MCRVLLIGNDAVYRDVLRDSFLTDSDFVICGEAKDGGEAFKKTMELLPDLVILETQGLTLGGFEVVEAVEAIKLLLPDVTLFLVAEQHDKEIEKKALSHGVDAVFEKDHDFTSLVINARAACGLE